MKDYALYSPQKFDRFYWKFALHSSVCVKQVQSVYLYSMCTSYWLVIFDEPWEDSANQYPILETWRAHLVLTPSPLSFFFLNIYVFTFHLCRVIYLCLLLTLHISIWNGRLSVVNHYSKSRSLNLLTSTSTNLWSGRNSSNYNGFIL